MDALLSRRTLISITFRMILRGLIGEKLAALLVIALLLCSNILLFPTVSGTMVVEHHAVSTRSKARDPVIGLVLTIVGLAFTIIDHLPGPDVPSAKIVDFDISTKELRVGEIIEVTGKARVNLGHVVDCGLFTCDYNDAIVKVCAEVRSTHKKTCFQEEFSNLADLRRRFGLGPQDQIQVDGDKPTVDIDFSFEVEGASDELNNGNDAVTVTVEVTGAEGGHIGQDPYVTARDSKTKPFKVRKAYKVNWKQPRGKTIIQGGEVPNFFEETMNIESLTTAKIFVEYAQLDKNIRKGVWIKPLQNKDILTDIEPCPSREGDPEGGAPIKIKMEPRKVRVIVDLKYSKDHAHTLEDFGPEYATCLCYQEYCIGAKDPDPADQPKTSDPILSGMVVDVDGNPISGVLVTLSEINGTEVKSTVTGSDGSFGFSIDAGVLWTLRASSDGYIDYESPIVIWEDESIKIVLEKRAYSVTGKVVDESGKPVTAEVLLEGEGEVYKTVTDENGTFGFYQMLPYGFRGNLSISDLEFSREFYEQVREIEVKDDLDLGTIVLKERPLPHPPILANITGVISDSNARAPIPNVRVKLVEASTNILLDSATTDYLGRFNLKGETGKKVYVVAELEGIEPVKTDVFTITGNLNLFDFKLPLTLPPVDFGKLIDELEKKVKVAEEEAEKLRVESESLKSKIKSLEDDLEEALTALEKTRRELDDAKSDLKEALQQLLDAKSEIGDLKAANAKLKSELNMTRENLIKYEEEIKELRDKIASAEGKIIMWQIISIITFIVGLAAMYIVQKLMKTKRPREYFEY